MFDLEWRLDEIGRYIAWCAAEHQGTEDDPIAFGGCSTSRTASEDRTTGTATAQGRCGVLR